VPGNPRLSLNGESLVCRHLVPLRQSAGSDVQRCRKLAPASAFFVQPFGQVFHAKIISTTNFRPQAFF